MTILRRQFLACASAALAMPALPRAAWALDYPTRPVRMVVPFPPGGAADITARLMGQWLTERMGQPFIIENKGGGGSNIGTEAVVTAPSDGYTLLLINAGNAINATLYQKLNFDFIRDIVPVEWPGARAARHVRHAFISGEDGCRVHRLRQGQPRQGQLRVGWDRQRQPHHRRDVQDDDRDRHGACAVSWRRAGADRSGRRSGAGHVRRYADRGGADQIPTPCARSASRPCRARRLLPDVPADRGCGARGFDSPVPGGASACRAARPAISSPSSTPRSMRGLADPEAQIARFADMGALLAEPARPAGVRQDDRRRETDEWGKVRSNSLAPRRSRRSDGLVNSQIFAGPRLTGLAFLGILFMVRSREGAILDGVLNGGTDSAPAGAA